jgi:glucan 1,3-beta-glucosidase
MIIKIFFYIFPILQYTVISQIKGVSLGSLFVLEPFIKPSLFYQFLGNKERVISDTYSFCDYLGPIKANKILKKHWLEWVNENTIKTLAESGINTIRIPVGDYMFIPYGPFNFFINGISCFSGSLEYLDTIINYINKYNINIIIDIHAWKDSQNGFDNSGETRNIETKLINNTLYYKHWDIRSADWLGKYDIYNKMYRTINFDNINHALNVIDIVLIKYKIYNIWGFCPMNEPWENIPEELLKDFYKEIYIKFVKIWDNKSLIFHDSFRPYLWESFDFLGEIPKIDIYLDTHQYKAWDNPVPFDTLISSIENWYYPKTCFKILIGEFSLATDNCIMWLNGFMDNVPGYPLNKCYYEKCPKLNEGLNKKYINNAKYGPFGTGESYPKYNGFCPVTTPLYLNKIITNNSFNIPDNNILNLDYYYEDMYATILFKKYSQIFENRTSGWIFWNFKTDSNSYSWNYLSSYKNGYINIKNDNINNINSNSNIININDNIKDFKLYIFNNFKYIFFIIILISLILILLYSLFQIIIKCINLYKLNINYENKPIQKKYYQTYGTYDFEKIPFIESINLLNKENDIEIKKDMKFINIDSINV